jgi:hypothetical protein
MLQRNDSFTQLVVLHKVAGAFNIDAHLIDMVAAPSDAREKAVATTMAQFEMINLRSLVIAD